MIYRGAPAGAGALRRGGRCGAEGRFFKEKAPQKPFLEKVFLGYPMGVGANMAVPAPEGARPVFAEGKDRYHGRFFCGPIFLWAERKQSQ